MAGRAQSKRWLKQLRSLSGLIILILLGGCAQIINVTTSEPLQINPGKRTLGTKIDDGHLETVTRVNLMKASPELADANINVDCFNGILLLTGEVDNQSLRQLAGDTATKINTLREVHNELLVRPATEFGERTYDNWLATKIRTKLLADSRVESGRIRVIAEAKNVYLMGLVSRHEAGIITDVVRKTAGVVQVIKVFEYID